MFKIATSPSRVLRGDHCRGLLANYLTMPANRNAFGLRGSDRLVSAAISTILAEMKDHRLIDERSLAFGQLIAAKLRSDPTLVQHARGNLERWLRNCSPRTRPALDEWGALLDGPLDELLRVLTSSEERAVRLRQSSPFAGILTPEERGQILRDFHLRELKLTLPELHDETTGRIDAKKVAEFIGVSLKPLAEGLGLNYEAVRRNPSASGLQEALQPVKRSLEILHEFFGSKETIRIWLKTPPPDLDGATALDTILEGKAFAVDRILGNAWNGVPL